MLERPGGFDVSAGLPAARGAARARRDPLRRLIRLRLRRVLRPIRFFLFRIFEERLSFDLLERL